MRCAEAQHVVEWTECHRHVGLDGTDRRGPAPPTSQTIMDDMAGA